MVTEIKEALRAGTKIFNPQAKIVANVDRAIEFIKTGNTAPVLIELDPSNTCNHGCYFCISSYIHLPESKNLEIPPSKSPLFTLYHASPLAPID